MKRGLTGEYEITATGGETVRAFVPAPLPPDPPLDLSGTRQRLLERALTKERSRCKEHSRERAKSKTGMLVLIANSPSLS
jgi:hypothetical protein